MTRLIDADALVEEIMQQAVDSSCFPAEKNMLLWLTSYIDTAPTIDAAVVTRCKDCESHRNRANMCDFWHHHTNGDGYCYRGRKYGGSGGSE